MRNRIRKEILHERRVRNVFPMFLNITIAIILLVSIAINNADKSFFRNPIMILLVLAFSISLFIIECWYVGGDEYLAIKE